MSIPLDTHHRDLVDTEVKDSLDQKVTIKPLSEILDKSRLPTSFDARVQWPGEVMDAMAQLTCGSCWAFAITGMIADRIRIRSDGFLDTKIEVIDDLAGHTVQNLPSLSPYYLAACDRCDLSDPKVRSFLIEKDECDQGCEGGILQNALLFIHRHGVVGMDCLREQEYLCDTSHNCPIFFIGTPEKISIYDREELYQAPKLLHYDVPESGNRLTTNINSIKSELMTSGPVVSGIIVYQSMVDSFKNQPGTIYEGPNPGEEPLGGHAVVIIGWVKYKNGEAWIIRNSWGHSWNINGHFRIKVGVPEIATETDVWAADPVIPPSHHNQDKFAFYDPRYKPTTVNVVELPIDTSAAVLEKYLHDTYDLKRGFEETYNLKKYPKTASMFREYF